MKILLVHNFYRSNAPSGENLVYEAERALLLSRGHEIVEYCRHSDQLHEKGMWGVIQGAALTPWNPWAAAQLKKIVNEHVPDIVHVHNTFPMISPAIFRALRGCVPRVLTLHNYRLVCPAAIPMRNGEVCTVCMDGRSVVSAIKHGCYRGSKVATLPLAANVALNRALGTWSEDVDGFVALTEFQKDRMAQSGLPLNKIHVKPNFYPGRPAVVPWKDRPPEVVFAGRMTAEKGVLTLLKAWALWGNQAPKLILLGDGNLRGELERLAEGLPVEFKGQLSARDAEEYIARSRLLVLPSEWFEGFPMVLREAFAFGTPAAVSNIGSLPSIVQNGVSGLVFKPKSPESLLRVVRDAWEKEGALEGLGEGARLEFDRKYTEEANYERLMQIYAEAQKMAFLGEGA